MQCKNPVLLRNWDGHPSARIGVNPLNAELNPICHLLALLGGATIVVVSRLRVKVEHDFELRGRNLARRGIKGKSQNSGLPVTCTRFKLGTSRM